MLQDSAEWRSDDADTITARGLVDANDSGGLSSLTDANGKLRNVPRDIGASTTPHSEMYCIMYVLASSCAR